MTDVAGCGAYIPRNRIVRSEVDAFHAQDGETAVPNKDESHVTMACEAAGAALSMAGVDGGSLDAVFAASTTDPFAVHGIAPHVAFHHGATGDVRTGDFRGSRRASTDALVAGRELLQADKAAVLVVGVDIVPTRYDDDESVYAGAGAGAFVLRSGDSAPAASILNVAQETTGFVERHRRHGDTAHVGDDRFERRHGMGPAVEAVADGATAALGARPDRGVVAAADERAASTALDDHVERYETVFDSVGDAGAAAFFLDTVAAIENSAPEETVLSVAYGAGGADAVAVRVRRDVEATLSGQLERKAYVDYTEHLSVRGSGERGTA